jgi:FkbM family methyltransferase
MIRGPLYARFVHSGFAAVRASRILQSSVGRSLFAMGYFAVKRCFEDSYAEFVRKRPDLFQGGDVLDVGANIGYTASLFARALPLGASVYAFEPEPWNFQLLTMTATKVGKRGRIVPVRAAVGAEDSSVELWLNPMHPGDHRVRTDQFEAQVHGQPTVTVPLVKIDTFVQNRGLTNIPFVKIDVQGFELAVCLGMEATLATHPELALGVEYAPDAIEALGFRPLDLLNWFWKRGYQISLLDGAAPLTQPPELEHGEYADLLIERKAP